MHSTQLHYIEIDPTRELTEPKQVLLAKVITNAKQANQTHVKAGL